MKNTILLSALTLCSLQSYAESPEIPRLTESYEIDCQIRVTVIQGEKQQMRRTQFKVTAVEGSRRPLPKRLTWFEGESSKKKTLKSLPGAPSITKMDFFAWGASDGSGKLDQTDLRISLETEAPDQVSTLQMEVAATGFRLPYESSEPLVGRGTFYQVVGGLKTQTSMIFRCTP